MLVRVAPHRSELCNLYQYIKKHNDKDSAMVFDLGQDATAWPLESNRGVLPCIMRGTTMLFATVKWRWFTARELLLAQGFPLCRLAKIASEPCMVLTTRDQCTHVRGHACSANPATA